MRILLVSQMYPSAAAPDFGVFVQGLERALAARGHELERVVLDRRGGGKLRHARLAAARSAPRGASGPTSSTPTSSSRPASAPARGARPRAPLVVTAHGQDVANLTEYPFVRPPARRVVKGAAAVIAVSEWLRERLVASIPSGRGEDRGRQLRRRPGAVPAARARAGPAAPRSSASAR